MLDIIGARRFCLKELYVKHQEELKEFAAKYDSLNKMDEETKTKYIIKLADTYTLAARLSICENEDIVGGDDEKEVVNQLIESKEYFFELATCETLPTLSDDPFAKYGKKAAERVHRSLLFAMSDECDALLQLIRVMKNFEGVADENGDISLDIFVQVLNKSGMKITKGELAAQLEYDGLLDKDNRPTQKAIDEGIFKPFKDDDS